MRKELKTITTFISVVAMVTFFSCKPEVGYKEKKTEDVSSTDVTPPPI